MTTEVVEPRSDAEIIAEFGPEWVVFWSGGGVRASQFAIWAPYLRRSRYRFVVVSTGGTTSDSVRDEIAAMPNVELLASWPDAKPWLKAVPTLRGFLYVGNHVENYEAINAFRGLVHIWIGHGDSGKAANAFRTASIFDSVFMGDYAAIGRFPRAIRRWVGQGACAIGVPIVEGVVADPWDRPRPVRTVLYAPTWEGYGPKVDYSSLGEFGPVLRDALPALTQAGVTVLLRPHPGSGSRHRPEFKSMVEELVAAGAVRDKDKTRAFATADVLISDVSGVVGEFLFTRKPTVITTSARLAGIKRSGKMGDEYPWVDLWPVEGLDLAARLDELGRRDPMRGARGRAANRMFRGHRSLEDAVRTFDIALDSVRFRKTPIPPRWVFEVRRRLRR